MDELLNNPAIQAGVAPFGVALILAALLRRSRLIALAVGAGLLTTIALVMGFSFEPMTSVRKMVVAGIGVTLGVLVLELAAVQASTMVRGAVALLATATAVWVVWPFLQQQEVGAALMNGVAAALYLAVLVDSAAAVGGNPIRASVAALTLGLGAGTLALLGASAMLAQVGISISVAAGAILLLQMSTGKNATAGWSVALLASVVAGLVGLLTVFTGDLRWYCLLPMLVISWATRFVTTGTRPVWQTAVLTLMVALIPVLLALGLAWFLTAAPAAT